MCARRFQYPVEWKTSNKPGASALFEVRLPTYALHVGGGGGRRASMTSVCACAALGVGAPGLRARVALKVKGSQVCGGAEASELGVGGWLQDPTQKYNTVGVVVVPVKIASVEQFGDLQFAADKLLAVENKKVRNPASRKISSLVCSSISVFACVCLPGRALCSGYIHGEGCESSHLASISSLVCVGVEREQLPGGVWRCWPHAVGAWGGRERV